LSARFALIELNHQPPLIALAYLAANAFVYISSLMLAEERPTPWGWGSILQRVLIVTILAIPMGRWFSSLMTWCDKRRRRRSLFRQKKGNQYTERA
jgi:hypothetical protein